MFQALPAQLRATLYYCVIYAGAASPPGWDEHNERVDDLVDETVTVL